MLESVEAAFIDFRIEQEYSLRQGGIVCIAGYEPHSPFFCNKRKIKVKGKYIK